MSDALFQIDVEINSSKSIPGVNRVDGALAQLERRERTTAAANDNLRSTFDRLGGSMRKSASDGNIVSNALDEIRNRAAGASPALGGLVNKLTAMGVAGTAAGVALVVTAGAMVKATSAANAFQDVMAKISTNVDTSKFKMDQLSAGILAQSAAFGGMPVDQAEAAYDIISAGAETAEQAITTLTSANKLAVGGMTTIGVAADGLTSILNAYASRGLTAAQASDAMFISARDGKTTIDQLSASVGQVAPIAAAVGVSFDEVAGSLAVLTKGGIKTSESVTGVKAILNSLIKPSDEAKKGAKSIGLEWDSNALKAKGLRGVLQDMAEKTHGSAMMMGVLLGGSEALTPALALTAAKGEEFAKTMDHMATKAGSTDAAVKKMLDGSPAAQWSRVTASANAELVKLGTTASTMAAPAFKFLADNMGTIVTVIEAAIIPLSLRMVAIWGTAAVQAITTLAATAAMRFASMAAAQGVLAASTATLSAGFNGLLSIVGGPLGIALGGAAYGLYTLSTNSSAARATVDQLASSAAETSVQAANAGDNSLLAARGVSTFGGQAGAAAEQLWKMASAARAASIETAKLNLQKANANLDTVSGQTSAGLAARYRTERETPKRTLGDAVRGVGRYAQMGYDYVMKPSEAVGQKAVKEALRQRTAAAKALGEAQIKPSEAFIPKPTPMVRDKPFAEKPDGKKKDSGANEAERKAKAESEFWKTLKGEAETAKLLPLAAEDYKKQLELAKIVGDAEAATQAGKLADLLQEARISKLITAMQVQHLNTGREIADQEALLTLKKAGASEQTLAVEKSILDNRNSALELGATQATFQTDAWKTAEAQLRTDQTRLGVLGLQNKAIDDQASKLKDMAQSGSTYGKDALKTNGTVGQRQEEARDEFSRVYDQLAAARDSDDGKLKISAAQFEAGVKKAGDEFRATMAEIGSTFSQKMGQIAGLLGTIGNIIGGKLGNFVNGVGDVSKSMGDFANTKNDIAGQFGKVFGANSPAVKSIGKAVGGAFAGMQIGEQMAGLTKALGFKGSATGGKIGGAIGGAAFGPIGAAVGGALGSVVGGLFKKDKKASAGFSMDAQGKLVGMDATGRGKEEKAVATALAGNVATSLNDIASQLGATITGLSGVSVGYRPGHKAGAYRVDTTGSGKLTGVAAFETEAEAIAFAIKDAIKDGVLGGLDDLAQKAVAALDIDGAVSLVKNWKAAMADFASMTDPVGAAIKGVTDGIDALRKSMVNVGASTTDLTKLDQYRAAKLNEVFKEQVSGFQSLLDDLNGNAGGVTALSQLTVDLSKLDAFKLDVASGKSVDQDAFTALAEKILGNAGEVYGTNTSDFQSIIGSLKDATGGAITNATNAFNSATSGSSTVAAISTQTNAITAQQGIANDYLRQIAESIQVSGKSYSYGSGSVDVYNGRLTQAF